MDQEQEERLQEIGSSILSAARDELYLSMRFLDVALSSFYYRMDGGADLFGTDGSTIYFEPRSLGGLYRENRVLVNRGYLHMVFHCIFRHFAGFSGTPGRTGKSNSPEKELTVSGQKALYFRYRDLSCDIAAEHLIDGLDYRCIRWSRSFLRRETYRLLEKEKKALNAERIFKILTDWNLSEKELCELEREFHVDDHHYWADRQPEPKPQPQLIKKWGEVSDGIQTDLETFSQEAGEKNGDFLGYIRTENRSQYSYREFLRKFSVFHEEMTVDDDNFDYSYYTYGLRLYGNMPLIEPLETREVKKVEEFAVVIDTSMSCSGDLVKRFLEETYRILSESGSFFKKINVHILQCDEKVHSDRKITSEKELKDYMENLDLYGEGGTDFRPAFAWVEQLAANHEFTNLKGLIYFTDGYGIYPRKSPPWRTAFVFVKDNYKDEDVPPWAMKLILDEEEL